MSCPMKSTEKAKGLCWRCEQPLPKYHRKWCSQDCALWYANNHSWSFVRLAALKRDGKCVRCGSTNQLEVNHIVPRNGQGYGPGCWHHLEGLETLCHECHVKVTTEQRRSAKYHGKAHFLSWPEIEKLLE